ncbi:MAG: hypothetical protein IJK17_06420 [Lachnospiraceae bacterium]|nr:hypothetical protein [Lachnospiraceae bacterium]
MKKEEFLEKEMDRVNSWLSFAEAKNAALIAFNVALLGVVNELPIIIKAVLVTCILASTIICMISFWPNLIGGNHFNAVYYRDIAEYEGSYEEYISSSYLDGEDGLKNDLAEEIVINSRIALKKYKRFKVALAIDLLAIIVLLAGVIIA